MTVLWVMQGSLAAAGFAIILDNELARGGFSVDIIGYFGALKEGWLIITQPYTLLAIVVATFIGLFIGIIPALGGMVAASLFIPLVYHMSSDIALPFLVSLCCVVYTGGCITTILLGIPGTAPNAATLIDGYPMTQKGQGGRAIGAAITASMFGGVLPVFMSLLIIPIIRPIVLSFKGPEMFMLVLLGLSFIAVLATESKIKGLISGFAGIIFSMLGMQVITGEYRFTFGIPSLSGGLDIIAVALGLFAIGEMFDMVAKGQTSIAGNNTKISFKDVRQGMFDVWKHKGLWLRSTIIGYVVGLFPGVGGDVAMFLAYSQAKMTAKKPEEFGTGRIEGVIAPESANNAKDAGAMLTTLAFGIPGSAVFSILMAGFLMTGVTPGPKLISTSLPLVFALQLGLAIANIVAGIIALSFASKLAKVSTIHMDYMFVVVLVLVCIGCYVTNMTFIDVVIAVIFGIVGFVMKRLNFSRPALVLGFVLGEQFETYFWRSYKLSGPTFFMTTGSLIMFGIIVLIFLWPLIRKIMPRRVSDKDGD
jgi:TctA family transporter